ncbi:MAG: Sua5/YciO/YrdC/YwlC family protein, partial [Clostridia bacterium]|nr:Sua5/YciO/YrdC/YwlC family protein [Clostridia bacterium]
MKEACETLLLHGGAKRDIVKAGRLLAAGEVVAVPTETVYGLAANALDEQAVLRIFEAKGRPQDNPLIVHISATEQIGPLVADFPA